jgi:hypothetical protein
MHKIALIMLNIFPTKKLAAADPELPTPHVSNYSNLQRAFTFF